MNTKKKLGIWLDHSSASYFDASSPSEGWSTQSKFTHEVKEEAIHKGENHMHTKQQQLQEAYYKEIGQEILKYDHVLLFGPTDAKSELYNYLQKDHHFKDIKFDIESSDKMTDNEKQALVRDHFSPQE